MTDALSSSVATLVIDIDAILRNFRALEARVAPALLSAVVKADCYGLGAARIAPELAAAGCRDFFVALPTEGAALRATLGPTPRIYVLNGFAPGDAAAYAEHALTPVLNSLAQCRDWAALGRGAAVLQVDTGMSRLGLSVAEQEALLADSALLARLDLTLLLSHLANADAPGDAANADQLAAFRGARQRFPHLPASLANSGASFLGAEFGFDLCRPGAALYGIEGAPSQPGIGPVIALSAPVIQCRAVPAGAGIGYGFTHRCAAPARLATIGVGYADGWPRALSGQGGVWWGDTRLPMVGRVSMDSCVVDITALPEGSIAEGDAVELIGPHQCVDDVARACGTIGYEVLTGLGRRFDRRYRLKGELQ